MRMIALADHMSKRECRRMIAVVVRRMVVFLICERRSADGMESVPGAVATGSQLTHDPGSRSRNPVATAPGTDLILKLRHYPANGEEEEERARATAHCK